MTRFGLAFGILLGAVGCGPVGGMFGGGTTEASAPFGLRGFSGGSHGEGEAPAGWPLRFAGRTGAVETGRGDNRTELADAAPDCVRVPGAALGFSRSGGGRGYVWIGYTVADVGQDGFKKFGRGDGFTFGGGFKLGESAHTFFEFAWERSLKHGVDPAITTTSKAFHERQLAGFRTTTAPRARLQNQPRPYVSYGVGYNMMVVKYGGVSYFANGVGPYFGLGCEFPSEGRSSFSFDTKFLFWKEAQGVEGEGNVLAFSLLWLNRF